MDSRRVKEYGSNRGDDGKYRSVQGSPNRKYRKNRTFNYESKTPHYLPAPELVRLSAPVAKKEANGKTKGEKTMNNEAVISERLISLLRESPDRVSEKLWRKRARTIGINIYNRDKSKKNLSELKNNLKAALEYIKESEGMSDKKLKIFKVSAVREFAEVIDITTGGKPRECLYNEILESLNEQ